MGHGPTGCSAALAATRITSCSVHDTMAAHCKTNYSKNPSPPSPSSWCWMSDAYPWRAVHYYTDDCERKNWPQARHPGMDRNEWNDVLSSAATRKMKDRFYVGRMYIVQWSVYCRPRTKWMMTFLTQLCQLFMMYWIDWQRIRTSTYCVCFV